MDELPLSSASLESPAKVSDGAAPASQQSAVASPFGANLEPVVRKHCEDRLSRISWFRTDWQRGGALTGYANYRDDEDVEQPVVVKLPVVPRERRWLLHLQECGVAPRVHAHGEELGGYDMAWVVMERLPHGPLGRAWNGSAFDLLIDAMVRFSAAAANVPVSGDRRSRDYVAICEEARDHIHRHTTAHEQRWNQALKSASHRLRDWLSIWEDRDDGHWCHGDIHLGNAMTRTGPPHGPALLLDFAEVHRGHWIEDAVHLEHFYWSRRDKLEGRKICKMVARQRKAAGLPVNEHWAKLASILRALIAMCTPVILRHVGDANHVEAALKVLEMEVA